MRTARPPVTRTSLCTYSTHNLGGRPRRRRRAGRTLVTMPPFEFTHLDPLGRARMVDVTPKEATHRRAVARCRVLMKTETASMIASGAITKGDVLAVARVAGIQAAKQTPNLLPLCHPLLVGSVYVNFTIEDSSVEVECQVETVDRTGVEMEALTACAVAALDREAVLDGVLRGSPEPVVVGEHGVDSR